MPLDPQAEALLAQMAATPVWYSIPLAEARQQRVISAPIMNGTPEPVEHVEDRAIPGPRGEIPVRIYTPESNGPFGVLIYFHGGGWVLSNLETHDALCRKLANRAACIVVSVDYRLAPEHKFPSAVEDAYAATCWVAEHIGELNGDPTRIAIGGDSAGGNLATIVTHIAHDQGSPPLLYQVLIYPVTDFYTPDSLTHSYHTYSEGYFLTREGMEHFWEHYLNTPEEGADPRVAPLRRSDLSGLPPALIITAEFDPLLDEGELYAARLEEAGVPMTLRRYDGMIHGFFTMSAVLDKSRQAIDETAQTLRPVFAKVQ
ncbi:MAG: alpha/beta hydrolase [Chloroflexota bacterium]|nr:alpha/beta hydrolase [Chloroflexota bacterium]